jgi:hypothetical protein
MLRPTKLAARGLVIESEPPVTTAVVPSEAKAAGTIDAKAQRVSRLAAIRDLIIVVELLKDDTELCWLIG